MNRGNNNGNRPGTSAYQDASVGQPNVIYDEDNSHFNSYQPLSNNENNKSGTSTFVQVVPKSPPNLHKQNTFALEVDYSDNNNQVNVFP